MQFTIRRGLHLGHRALEPRPRLLDDLLVRCTLDLELARRQLRPPVVRLHLEDHLRTSADEHAPTAADGPLLLANFTGQLYWPTLS